MEATSKMSHVLIVDDDRSTVRLLTMWLEMEGYQVSKATRGELVLEMGHQDGIDAFVIDCHLPDTDGLELVRAIRADGALAGKAVIVTSGRELSREALSAGADTFLLKPFLPSDLSNRLAELIR
jgi:DNA-binding response OmpR family regulator